MLFRSHVKAFLSPTRHLEQATNSHFCYGDEHVSSRQLVCGGEIISAGKWDKYGRQTEIVKCCRGTPYVFRAVTYKVRTS